MNVWTYYPYNKELRSFLKHLDADLFMLVRDPRDIIVSTAHFCDKYPNTFLNYKIGDRHFSDMGMEERIDHLIDDILEESLFDYERWRLSGLFKVIHFRHLLDHPIAGQYQNWKRRGITGAYLDEMTREQIERSTIKYKELIDAWQ